MVYLISSNHKNIKNSDDNDYTVNIDVVERNKLWW